jgi:hypothetical protein
MRAVQSWQFKERRVNGEISPAFFCTCSLFNDRSQDDLFASAVRSDISIRKKMNLENEIIAAVVVLYLFLSAVIVLVHYLQPEGQETKTSSPAHTEVQEGGNEIQTP